MAEQPARKSLLLRDEPVADLSLEVHVLGINSTSRLALEALH